MMRRWGCRWIRWGGGKWRVFWSMAATAWAVTRRRTRRRPATSRCWTRIENVPLYGITVGVGTICEQSKRVVMVVHGADKAEATRRLVKAEHYESDWPATILSDCVN